MKKGHFDSKTGGNGFFQKTESESWGLPLMNGGLKIVFLIVCLDFPQNLTAKNIQNLGLQILSVGFIFFFP